MILNREEILEYIKNGEIKIEPFEKSNVGVDSIDLRLGKEILIAKAIGKTIDPKKPENYWEKVELKDSIEIGRGDFILASTLEKISIGNKVAAFIEGRSSIGRLGIMVHVTAGVIHAGFGKIKPSRITLEIYSVNPNPVKLYYGMKIAQLVFIKLSKPSEVLYDEVGRYVGLKGPLPPKPL